MTKLFSILAILSLSVVTASGTEQGTVDHCAAIVRDFRQMPERGIPRDVLRHSKGLAIMTVVKPHLFLAAKAAKALWSLGQGMAGPAHHLSAQAARDGAFRSVRK